jgi:hypothetical protein
VGDDAGAGGDVLAGGDEVLADDAPLVDVEEGADEAVALVPLSPPPQAAMVSVSQRNNSDRDRFTRFFEGRDYRTKRGFVALRMKSHLWDTMPAIFLDEFWQGDDQMSGQTITLPP